MARARTTRSADELLRPSVIYAPAMRKLASEVEVHAFAHITGGGIPGNLDARPAGPLRRVVRRGAWDEPRIFAEIQAAGDVADDEMEHVFNLGLGMLAVVPARRGVPRRRRRARRRARRLGRRRDRRRSRVARIESTLTVAPLRRPARLTRTSAPTTQARCSHAGHVT